MIVLCNQPSFLLSLSFLNSLVADRTRGFYIWPGERLSLPNIVQIPECVICGRGGQAEFNPLYKYEDVLFVNELRGIIYYNCREALFPVLVRTHAAKTLISPQYFHPKDDQ